MSGESILSQLRRLAEPVRQLGVRRLTLFGPEARGESRPGGEVHLLLELAPPYTFDHYLMVRQFLEPALGRPVELVMESVEHPRIWEFVAEDAIDIIRPGI
jgi:uncharacterized protein